jgi:hypothetical protein
VTMDVRIFEILQYALLGFHYVSVEKIEVWDCWAACKDRTCYVFKRGTRSKLGDDIVCECFCENIV